MKKMHKGMTLVEVIVALALFAIMGLVVATVFSASANLNRATNIMNNKMQSQMALANVMGTTGKDVTTSDKITFEIERKSFVVDVDVRELEKNKPVTNDDAKSKVNSNIKFFTRK